MKQKFDPESILLSLNKEVIDLEKAPNSDWTVICEKCIVVISSSHIEPVSKQKMLKDFKKIESKREFVKLFYNEILALMGDRVIK